MTENDFAQRVERAFVDLVVERAERKRFKKGEFAAMVWPDMNPKAAATRWNSVRSKAFHTGKPQSVPIADAQRMASALGLELSYLLVIAAENAQAQINPAGKKM
jgi:hypothetical protein